MNSSSVLRNVLVAASLLFASGNASAQDLHIPLYHASYSVNRNDFKIGMAEFTLTQGESGKYIYKSVTQPTGLASLFFSEIITETSEFSVRDGHPCSLSYSYVQTGNDDADSERINFNWKHNRAKSIDGNHHKMVKLQPATYDRALAQLAVSLDLASGKLADSYRVLDHGSISDYHMEREADTTLRTPNGKYDVIKVTRKDTKKNRVTTFWLAPTLDYLPVKIEQTEPGKATISLVLADLKFDTGELVKTPNS